MLFGNRILVLLGCLLIVSASLLLASGIETADPPWNEPPPPPHPSAGPWMKTDPSEHPPSVEATVINPFRTADVGTEIGGVIQAFHFDEGDKVNEGDVVLEIDPERYRLAVQKAEERVHGLEKRIGFAEEEARAKEDLFRLDSASLLDMLRAKAEFESVRSLLAEARIEVQRANKDLECCKVRAPFSGHLATRYKQPHETVNSLEKVFALVDSERVYAVAQVPIDYLDQYKQGIHALFVHRPGEAYPGTVDHVGKVIDPRTRCKKVYVLINNPIGALEVGMTGSLQLREPT